MPDPLLLVAVEIAREGDPMCRKSRWVEMEV